MTSAHSASQLQEWWEFENWADTSTPIKRAISSTIEQLNESTTQRANN
jgi:hypothetical protein